MAKQNSESISMSLKAFALSLVFMLVSECAIAPRVALAQTAQAAISGNVRDPAGRSVPDATIEVEQRETGWNRRTETGSAGTCSVLELPIGSYSVTVSQPGFEKSKSDVELLVGQERVLDFQFVVAGKAVQVDVTSPVSEIDYCYRRGRAPQNEQFADRTYPSRLRRESTEADLPSCAR
jgi:hypothetical protein